MIMRFTIVKNSGSNRPSQLSYDFSPPGGTIGRSPENTWHLPDENLAIARLQVIVSISADGECRINNQGSSSDVLLNTIPLTPDRQIEVRDGDILNIGDYQIQLTDINNHSSQNNPSSQQSTTPVSHTDHSNVNQTGIPNEVWDGLEHMFTTPDNPFSADPHRSTQNQIKPDLNDNHPLTKDQHDKERNPIDPLAQIETPINLDSLQLRATDPIAMFRSDSTFQQENILHDPTPTALLSREEPSHEHDDEKQETDPLKLFADKHVKPAQSVKNDALLNQILDNAVPLSAVNEVEITEPQTESISQPSASVKHVDLFQSVASPETTPPSMTSSTDNPVYSETPASPLSSRDTSRHAPTPTESPPQQTNNDKLEGALLAALLEGMGLKGANQLQFDEAQMYQLGLLISQLTQGIITLNASRNQLKHDTNATETQFPTHTNNPFKFLPSGQAVLALMFNGHIPGLMPLEQATRDILLELQAHQSGMMAGVRAAAAEILHQFHPAILEQKAREDDCLPRLSLLSTNKAAMWDYLSKYYQKTIHEFEQDSVLLSENFLQAYEAEVNRYKNTQKR
ncbi:Conserved hypothetical protein with FHA domain (probable component of SST VI cluster) [Xenorhabdus poinarii G6]|uniref:Uncharacterized protein n=1 Tax=Xenorhabdus poinarii G6 TaxID=1354304 RepID=A0A068R2H9_9GAMM|nr:type VI secretion system-associated FHA domain protein [Xenorhabdus poinarii]CDG21497.1 Conserved hypothetical protein with FHA domain (probable component of SST VI cluster) [Xenorhabdus poinarii G6]